MTSIEGLSSEFYHMHDYRIPLIDLAHELDKTYQHRWMCYRDFVDISLRPQAIEINLMGMCQNLRSLRQSFDIEFFLCQFPPLQYPQFQCLHRMMPNRNLCISGFGCFPNVIGKLSSPPRSTLFVLPRPSSSNFKATECNRTKQKPICYSHVAVVEATTCPVQFSVDWLPALHPTNKAGEPYFLRDRDFPQRIH